MNTIDKNKLFPANPPPGETTLEMNHRIITEAYLERHGGLSGPPVTSPTTPGDPEPPKLSRITCADLVNETEPEEYLIDGILTRHKPFLVSGAEKCLKTSLMVDLAISLNSGKPFLGKFEVLHPARVGMLSGESGRQDILQTAQAVAKSKKLDLPALGIIWSESVLDFDSDDSLAMLSDFIKQDSLEVLICDPAYLNMPRADFTSVVSVGRMLARVNHLCRSLNCQFGLVHHDKKTTDTRKPSTLNNVTGAGFGPFFRQWLLLRRRSHFQAGSIGKYQTDLFHELYMTTGGARRNQTWAVDVRENDWHIEIQDAANIADSRQDKQAEADAEAQETIIGILENAGEPLTAYKLRIESKFRNDKVKKCIDALLLAQRVVKDSITIGGKERTAYSLCE